MSIEEKPPETRCLSSNREVVEKGLAFDTFGNVSIREKEYCFIKPSGIDLNICTEEDISQLRIDNGESVKGKAPSSDKPTHLELYRSFDYIGGITHTHSRYATAWAQAVKPIPCLGTMHADYWKGEIPVSRPLTIDEIKGEYELETGKVLVETIQKLGFDPGECPGILVAHHGPFTWGKTVEEAVKNAERLEYIAKLAWMTLQLNPYAPAIPSELHHRHYSRKHGPGAYYGQENS